jgi:hypothetical protein
MILSCRIHAARRRRIYTQKIKYKFTRKIEEMKKDKKMETKRMERQKKKINHKRTPITKRTRNEIKENEYMKKTNQNNWQGS